MKLSDNGLKLIAGFEGCITHPYRDASGYSIGYGHFLSQTEQENQSVLIDGQEVSYENGLTVEQCQALLRQDAARFEEAVNRLVKVGLSQNQFDTLVSFTYNVGEGALANSTLLRLLNQGDYAGAAGEFSKWDHSQGRVVQALVERREKEKELFLA